ncbi:hypothetical protein RhiXN_05174 [Rhizoctonia solani]|uniref:Spt20 family n=1 Tax=Rhizoctonia solani TaxID=456999 RepID=A0A8H7H7X5_9AGAM|nr:uncharacterized protein RhiXN_05174 [Rhizoctonia solani]KAF8677554.1 Spt20 family [Rhizoctonia solani]QRW17172.1 hypothetical protein RhiXN_05174 [Rhizoctonia solani]
MTAVYNYKKREEQILARFSKSPPSFTVHLYSGHWTLSKDNNARTFLYNSPAVSILDSIRAHQVPVDMLEMLDQANVPFYDGCLIVEEHDHSLATGEATPSDPSVSDAKTKPITSPAQKRRIVLYPNGETLWADISILNARNGNTWTDQQAIEFEAKILAAIAPPLCLDPDPIASKIASVAMNSTSLHSPKRKPSSMENDKRDDTARKAEHDKFMNVMNPRATRIFHPDFRQITWLEQNRRGERPSTPPGQSPGSRASVAPTPTPPPGSASGLPESIDDSSSQKKKLKKKREGPDSPMQVDAPSPGLNSTNKSRKNSISQIPPLQIGGGKKKQGQQGRRNTASSMEPSPAINVSSLPPHTTNGQVSAIDSPQSIQASPNPALGKKEDMQPTLGIGIPPPASHSPAPTGQQTVSGPPKKRMKTETPSIGNVPLPGVGSQQGTPQQSYLSLNPHLAAPGQQPNPAQPGIHRYSASPAPTPTTANGQPTQQYPGQLQHSYGPLGLNIANGMVFNNGTGAPAYNAVPGMQQAQMSNIHTNMFAQNQQQAANQAGSPHPHPPSRPASQASIPMRNSPHQPQPMALGGNAAPNLQTPQQGDQQGVRPASGPGQQGMQMNPGMHQPGGQMQMPVDQMLMFRQMQRMGYPGAQNMMQYPGFTMQMPAQTWQMGQMPMGVGRGQQLQQQLAAAAAMQRRGAMQAPPNPQR